MKVIISPHMDDAVLSLGGYLGQSDENNFHILCIFNSVWTCLPEYRGRDVNSLNKDEHEKILKTLGCTWEYWDYPESNQRGYDYWNTPLDIFKDSSLYYELRNQIKVVLYNDRYSDIYFPMAVEKHADHELIYRILCDLLTDDILANKRIFLYEDLPYSFYVDMNDWISEVRKVFLINSTVFDISEYVEQKVDLLSLYKTQVEKRDIDAVIEYAFRIGKGKYAAERIWEIEGRI